MDKGIEALIAHMKWRIKDAAQDGHNMIGVKSDELAELIAALELAQQYSKKRDEENQDLMLTIGRLRVEREQMESAPNGMMQLSNELAEMKPVKLPSAWIEPGNRWLQERDVIEAIRAAGGTAERSE